MRHSTKLALLSYIPNFCSSFLYLYLSATFDYSFPFIYVIPSMIFTFTVSAIIIKIIARPIDNAVKEFNTKGSISSESLSKFKKAHFNLTKLIPIFFILLMTFFVLLINILFGHSVTYFFKLKFILEISHLIGIFSISFLAHTAIFNYNIIPLRKLFKITDLKDDILIKFHTYIFLLCLSFIITIGATFAYYAEDMISSIIYSKSYANDLQGYYSSASFDEQAKYLEHIINEKIKDHQDSINIQKKYLENLKNSDKNTFHIDSVRFEDSSILFYDPFHLRAMEVLGKHQTFFSFFIICIIFYAYAIIYLFTKGYREQANSISSNIAEIVDLDKEVQPLIITDTTEISILTDSFNKLLNHLESKNEILKELNLDLEEKVHERTKELHDAMVQLQHISLTDDLTQLKNRKYFDICLSRELNKNCNLSLIYFDLDHFKKVNDTYGHLKGDKVLINTAKLIKETIRETDIAARWGGEEFIIILPNTGIDETMKLAEKLRKALEEFEHSGIDTVTASFGCTSCRENDNEDSILHRCDQALYLSKENGRNCVSKK